MFIYLCEFTLTFYGGEEKQEVGKILRHVLSNDVLGFPVLAILPSYLKFPFVNLIPFRIEA